ncbi:MAG: carbohydrate porin [Gallionellaceae bacterium]|jgi:carbohydrate-selective porin OprB|nr:carbohydrate porin [Gallionellaceae bacterium]
MYYNWRPVRHLWVSPDLQYIQNPGYNRDRGPAVFGGMRLHTEF